MWCIDPAHIMCAVDTNWELKRDQMTSRVALVAISASSFTHNYTDWAVMPFGALISSTKVRIISSPRPFSV